MTRLAGMRPSPPCETIVPARFDGQQQRRLGCDPSIPKPVLARAPPPTGSRRGERSVVFERMTTDARSVIADMPQHAWAADRREMTRWDLAAALAVSSGNTADLWPAKAAETPAQDSGIAHTVPPTSKRGPYLRFDREVRAVLEQALAIALQQRAEHVGTEHLLAALVRTGPADVVAWLGTRGATAEAVDALLARLNGDAGVEQLAASPSRTDRRRWRRATARVHGGWQAPGLLATVAVVLAVIVVFALCIWGP
jgi:hypothetical protein